MEGILLISCPFPIIGGGETRSYQILKHIKKYFDQIEIIIPPSRIREIVKTRKWEKYISKLEKNVYINTFSLKILEDTSDKEKLKNSDRHINIQDFLKWTFPKKMELEYKKYARICLLHSSLSENKNTIIYSHHEYFDAAYIAYYLSKRLQKYFAILLQLEPFRDLKDSTINYFKFKDKISIRDLINIVPIVGYNIFCKRLYNKLTNSMFFKNFLSVSLSPIILSNLRHCNYTILKPANAFEYTLLKYRKNLKKKENYAVFFARFSPEKGIFELPRIWKRVSEKIPDAKLIICGKQNPISAKKFKYLIKKYKLEDNISIKGYVPRNKLFDIVSKAKVFVYPSHSDAFPLVTLESLAVGTPIVAYNIHALKIYQSINAVKTVKEWDTKQMADTITDIFKLNESDYIEMMDNKKLVEFLRLHSSWDKVAKLEANILKNIF